MTNKEMELNLNRLEDLRLKFAARLSGVDLEIAMANGDKEAARKHMDAMRQHTLARHAKKFAAWEASH